MHSKGLQEFKKPPIECNPKKKKVHANFCNKLNYKRRKYCNKSCYSFDNGNNNDLFVHTTALLVTPTMKTIRSTKDKTISLVTFYKN